MELVHFVLCASEINTTCMGPIGREVLLQLDVRTSVMVFEQQLEMFVSPQEGKFWLAQGEGWGSWDRVRRYSLHHCRFRWGCCWPWLRVHV